jgi:hypothetical protein
MSGDFTYKPRFVDIRIKPPPQEARARPGEQLCQHPGCARPATCRAPKSRDDRDLWHFCAEHAALYNANWDYFSGMSAEELSSFEAAAAYGHRPTWSWKPSAASREARAARGRPGAHYADPHGVFGARARHHRAPEPERARVSRIQAQAFAELDLPENAEPSLVRARYAELVKRFHPDANGGDRSSEHRLQKVMRAYQVLKRSRMG